MDIFDELKKDAVAVYQCGSTVLDYITRKHDKDICYFYATTDIMEKKRQLLKKYRSDLRNSDIDVHVKDLSVFDPFLYVWMYQWKYMKLLDGEPLVFADFDITEHKDECLSSLRQYAEHRLYMRSTSFYKMKSWYHIYTCLKILENNSYDLTAEQIKNINILHDNYDVDDERKSLIQWCLNELNIDLPEFTE